MTPLERALQDDDSRALELLQRLDERACLPARLIEGIVVGSLSPAESVDVREHLAACLACLNAFARLQSLHAADAPDTARTAAIPLGTRPRILVVDDELAPREALRMVLEPWYEIQAVDSGGAALEQIPTYQPDVVILDIKMPELDGLEVLKRIKRTEPAIEVVMITGHASLATVKQALAHGAFDYLIKPFSRSDLEDVVRRALVRTHAEPGSHGHLARLVVEMRRLSADTRAPGEPARRETIQQSLRVTQLSILREISRTVITQLDDRGLIPSVISQLHSSFDYDVVSIAVEAPPAEPETDAAVVACEIRGATGRLGWLVVDNRASGRPVDLHERELLEMLSDDLAIAMRSATLYRQMVDTKCSLEQVIDSVDDAIITVTAADRINGWNAAAERTFGLSAKDALGREIIELLPEPEYSEARGRLAGGSELEEFEFSRAHGHARPLTLAVSLSGLRNRNREADGFVAIVRDVTIQRGIAAELHQSEKVTAFRATSAFESQHPLSAISDLISMLPERFDDPAFRAAAARLLPVELTRIDRVASQWRSMVAKQAHEMANVLQTIDGYAQLVKQNPDDRELIERARASIEGMTREGFAVVRRFLRASRTSHTQADEHFVSVDVNQLVRDVIAINWPGWEEGSVSDRSLLNLRLDLQAQEGIYGGPGELSQALINLIVNAMEAMPQGGTLSIATKDTPRGEVQVIVADTGIGMSETVRQRIFEPFYSTKGEGGSGLGLSIADAIVRRHRGEIHVNSEPDVGTTFTLVFQTLPPIVSGRPADPHSPGPGLG
jgi:PAS domain S-box-containing protein